MVRFGIFGYTEMRGIALEQLCDERIDPISLP
jgi:hypothetical protein